MNLSVAFEFEKNQFLIRSLIDDNSAENYIVDAREANEITPSEAQTTIQAGENFNQENLNESKNEHESDDINNHSEDKTKNSDTHQLKNDHSISHENEQTLTNLKKFNATSVEKETLKDVAILISENAHPDLFSLTTLHIPPTQSNLSTESILDLNYREARSIFTKFNDDKTLKNNLELITSLTSEGQRLSKVFLENREVFILNLWKLFYQNLSVFNLNILFQNIESKDSKKLVCKKLDAPELKSVMSCSESEELLFKDLQSEFGRSLNISSYDKENGQLTMTSTIKSTKIIIMAEVHHFSVLQKATLTGVLNSISHFI